jgi:hypothetical protein
LTLDPKAQLRELRNGLDLLPEEINTKTIAPVFVPSSFFALGNWPGPHINLAAKGIGLTWAVLLPGQSMRYVDFGMQEYWDVHSVDWKALALGNLMGRSGEELGTHAFRRGDGEIYGLAFMHPDGIGPSRLLLTDWLSAKFPSGYQVALPEMSCALAFSTTLDTAELAEIQNIVDNCYRNGTRPLAPGIYSPNEILPTQ